MLIKGLTDGLILYALVQDIDIDPEEILVPPDFLEGLIVHSVHVQQRVHVVVVENKDVCLLLDWLGLPLDASISRSFPESLLTSLLRAVIWSMILRRSLVLGFRFMMASSSLRSSSRFSLVLASCSLFICIIV